MVKIQILCENYGFCSAKNAGFLQNTPNLWFGWCSACSPSSQIKDLGRSCKGCNPWWGRRGNAPASPFSPQEWGLGGWLNEIACNFYHNLLQGNRFHRHKVTISPIRRMDFTRLKIGFHYCNLSQTNYNLHLTIYIVMCYYIRWILISERSILKRRTAS